MAEWLNAMVLKTIMSEMASRVRIPISPPVALLVDATSNRTQAAKVGSTSYVVGV